MMIHCSNGRRSFPFGEMNWKIYSKSSMREKVQKNHKMNEAKREKKKEQADWNMTQKDTYCLPLLGSPLPLFYTLVSGCPKVNVLKWWWCEDSHLEPQNLYKLSLSLDLTFSNWFLSSLTANQKICSNRQLSENLMISSIDFLKHGSFSTEKSDYFQCKLFF